ncbi:MAG: EI24 domain-containing protein [Mariprofundus sp.]|nr:EI24 domain-containing protein [Mariprofundus sp.]
MLKGGLILLAGMRLLLSRAELRAVLWRMLALLLVLMLGLTFGVFWLVDYIAALWIPEGDAWYWQILSWLVAGLAFVLAMLCGIVSFVTLGSAVSAPWLDMLAARTDAISGHGLDEQGSDWLPMIMQSLANSVRPLLGLLLWGGAALLFFWLPPLATAIWTYGAVRFLSFELIDTPASRRGWRYQERKKQLIGKRWLYLGFAGLSMLLLMVPVVNLLVIPAAVVGLSQYLSSEES